MLKKVPQTTVVCPGLINAIALSSIDEHNANKKGRK